MTPKHKLTVIIERDEEGYYVASVPALLGCHTPAMSPDILRKRVRRVARLCLKEANGVAPALELVGILQIAV